jgi:hypothetical protein
MRAVKGHSINQQHLVLILRVWPLIIGVCWFSLACTQTPCYVHSDKKGIEIVAGEHDRI